MPAFKSGHTACILGCTSVVLSQLVMQQPEWAAQVSSQLFATQEAEERGPWGMLKEGWRGGGVDGGTRAISSMLSLTLSGSVRALGQHCNRRHAKRLGHYRSAMLQKCWQ